MVNPKTPPRENLGAWDNFGMSSDDDDFDTPPGVTRQGRAPQPTSPLSPMSLNMGKKTPTGSGSRKRARADESDDLDLFRDLPFAEVAEVDDLEEEEPLIWEQTAFSTTGTSFVADIPTRPGQVAVRAASVKGKPDLVMVVQASHYREAVEMFRRPLDYCLPPATDGYEDEPHPGVIPSKNAPPFQRASRNDAIRATLQTKQPYGDELHKFLALGSLFHWETPAEQTKMEAAFPEAQSPEHASLFKTANNVAVPRLVVRVVHDSGAGKDVDRSGRVQADDKVLITFDGGVIGGAQRGARRMVVLGSEEDQRLNTPEVAATTVTDSTMIIPLYDAFVLAARSDTLYQTGPWLNKNVVGLAKVGGRHRLSLVKTREGSTRGGEPWVYLVIVTGNWEYCWSGPFFVAMVTRWGCFSGYKNLGKHDKTARGMQVGRSGDFSNPATKAIATLREETVKHAAHQRTIDSGRTPLRGNVDYTAKERGAEKSTNERKGEGGAASSGTDCNQVGAGPNENKAAKKRRNVPVHAGDEGAEEASSTPASKPLRERGLCLGLSSDGVGLVAKLQESINLETGSILVDPSLWCDKPAFEELGHLTRGDSVWQEDGNGCLVLGYHNGNIRGGKTPRCYAGTVPVVKVDEEWLVPEWALRYIGAGKVVQRNTDNHRNNGQVKKARAKRNARKQCASTV